MVVLVVMVVMVGDICKLSCDVGVGGGEEESEVVTSCSGSGGRAGFAQPASRVNLSRLLLVAGGVTSQYFTGQRDRPILPISHS